MKINKLVIAPLGPAPWRTIDFAGKDCYGSREGDVHRIEVAGVILILPVEPRRRGPRICEPVERDIVEHLIARERELGLAAAISPIGKLVIDPCSKPGRGIRQTIANGLRAR